MLTLLGHVEAGFPTAGEEELLDTMSLDEYLIDNREAAFVLVARGESMADAGILDGDLLIVERGREPKRGDVVIIDTDGAYDVRHYRAHTQKVEAVVTAVVRKY